MANVSLTKVTINDNGSTYYFTGPKGEAIIVTDDQCLTESKSKNYTIGLKYFGEAPQVEDQLQTVEQCKQSIDGEIDRFVDALPMDIDRALTGLSSGEWSSENCRTQFVRQPLQISKLVTTCDHSKTDRFASAHVKADSSIDLTFTTGSGVYIEIEHDARVNLSSCQVRILKSLAILKLPSL